MRTRTNSGFTLVEILMATALTGIIMTAVAGAFLALLQAREEVRSLSDSTSAGPRILSQIERDLQGLWHNNIRDNKVFLGRNIDIAGFPADRIDFLTTTDAIGAIDDGTGIPKRPSVCEVGYWLKENEKYGDLRELWRREDPMVDDDLTTGGTFQLVHDRIKTFEITYFKTLGAKAEPFYEWDTARNNELPRRIKIEFTVESNLPNRNRVSGLEAGNLEDAIQKYTRHIVFDSRYPEILQAGIAMIPILPGPPQEADGGRRSGGGGEGFDPEMASQEITTSAEAGNIPQGNGGPVVTERGQNTTQTGPGNQGSTPTPPPPRTIDINDLLKGGGGGGGLFGPGGPFGR